MEEGTPMAQIHDLTPVDGEIERRVDPATRLAAVLDARDKHNTKKWKRRVAIFVPIITAVLGGGTYAGLELKPPDAPPVLPSDLQTELEEVKDNSEENTQKIRALGKVTIEGMDYLGEKIDKAHPEVAVEDKPESLKDAEKDLEEEKAETRLDEILNTGGTPQE